MSDCTCPRDVDPVEWIKTVPPNRFMKEYVAVWSRCQNYAEAAMVLQLMVRRANAHPAFYRVVQALLDNIPVLAAAQVWIHCEWCDRCMHREWWTKPRERWAEVLAQPDLGWLCRPCFDAAEARWRATGQRQSRPEPKERTV